MCFSKGKKARKNHNIVKLGNHTIEHTDSYRYLGIELSESGSYKTALQSLYAKALRALFKLKTMTTRIHTAYDNENV